MATALKNIQFTKPVLIGEANASNGTTYALGSADVLGPVKYGVTLVPGDIASSRRWVFDGVAEYAKSAVYAELATSAESASAAYKATHIDFGSDLVHSLGSATVGSFDSAYFDFGTTGSWGKLTDAFGHIMAVLGPLDSKNVATINSDD